MIKEGVPAWCSGVLPMLSVQSTASRSCCKCKNQKWEPDQQGFKLCNFLFLYFYLQKSLQALWLAVPGCEVKGTEAWNHLMVAKLFYNTCSLSKWQCVEYNLSPFPSLIFRSAPSAMMTSRQSSRPRDAHRWTLPGNQSTARWRIEN